MIKPAERTQRVQEYYFSKKLQEIEQMNQAEPPVLNLGIGNPDLFPSDATIQELCQQAQTYGTHGYQSYKGIPELRQAFAQWYRHWYQVDLHPDTEILPLMGSKEGIMHISMAYLNPGDQVLIPNPGYPTYAAVSALLSAEAIAYDLTEESNWLPDFAAIEQQDLSRVKIMWVNYPHMPTGKAASKELFAQLIAFGKKHNILICNDNPYSFILNDEPLSILATEGAKEVAIELNSLSKSHNMAGFRIGMVGGAAAIIAEILKVKSNMDSGMYKPLQYAAAKALESGTDWFEYINESYKKRRELAYQIFDLCGASYDKKQTGMFIWAKIPDSFTDSYAFSDKYLYESRVFLTPGAIFGSNGEQYARISLCSNEETLKEVIKRITKE